MGKLTKSLKAATQKLSDLKEGIAEMQQLSQELADNTLEVADAALRTGYAYGKAEAASMETQSSPEQKQGTKALTSDRPTDSAMLDNGAILDADQLKGATQWTERALKARFKTLEPANHYLKETYGLEIAKKRKTWQDIVDLFNGKQPIVPAPTSPAPAKPPSLEKRVLDLETLVQQQSHQIATLQAQLQELMRKSS
jgi:hypothetical protein